MTDLDALESTMPVGPLKLAVLDGCKEFGAAVDRHLVDYRHSSPIIPTDRQLPLSGYTKDSYLLDISCPRFGTGEGKGQINESVRGCDLYLLCDITNYSLTYTVCGHENHMSPDNHYQDLKRLISAS